LVRMADPIPYIRLFVGAFAADTQHLTASQLGNHTRMLMLEETPRGVWLRWLNDGGAHP